MKIKLGDLTTKQLHNICTQQPNCINCPLTDSGVCDNWGSPSQYKLDKEIELPDEEEE